MHNNNCRMFHLAVDQFLLARPANFITSDELRILMALAPPCHECSPLSTMLSPLTNRLYKIVWDRHHKKPDAQPGNVVDMFDGQ